MILAIIRNELILRRFGIPQIECEFECEFECECECVPVCRSIGEGGTVLTKVYIVNSKLQCKLDSALYPGKQMQKYASSVHG